MPRNLANQSKIVRPHEPMTRIKPMREMSLDAGRFDATSALDQIDDLRRQFADLGRRFDRLSRRK